MLQKYMFSDTPVHLFHQHQPSFESIQQTVSTLGKHPMTSRRRRADQQPCTAFLTPMCTTGMCIRRTGLTTKSTSGKSTGTPQERRLYGRAKHRTTTIIRTTSQALILTTKRERCTLPRMTLKYETTTSRKSIQHRLRSSRTHG